MPEKNRSKTTEARSAWYFRKSNTHTTAGISATHAASIRTACSCPSTFHSMCDVTQKRNRAAGEAQEGCVAGVPDLSEIPPWDVLEPRFLLGTVDQLGVSTTAHEEKEVGEVEMGFQTDVRRIENTARKEAEKQFEESGKSQIADLQKMLKQKPENSNGHVMSD